MMLDVSKRFPFARALTVALVGLSPCLAFAQPAPGTPPAGTAGPASAAPADVPPEPPADDPQVERARGAFMLGASLAREGQWKDALAAFERAAEIRPHAVTTYNLGYVERALGRLTRAKVRLEAALREELMPEDRRLPGDLVVLARGYLAEIDEKLARVSITLRDADLAIAVDGRPLEPLPGKQGETGILVAGTAPSGPPARPPRSSFLLLVDPGDHVFVTSTPGGGERTLHQDFASGVRTILELGDPSKPAPKQSASGGRSSRDEGTKPGSSKTTLMWTAYGIGALGVVAGSMFGLLAYDLDKTLEGSCLGKICDRSEESDVSRLDMYTWGANIGWIVAGLGAGVGTYFLLTRGSGSKDQTHGTVRVGLGPTGAVVRGAF
jgi:hypothetical protein